MRLANAVQSTFSKTGTRAPRLGSGLTRVSLNRPMGIVLSRHAPASAYDSTAPFGVLFRIRCARRTTSGSSSPAAPRDALRFGDNRAGRPV
jgi:hypothetical protein